jgi:hypothetical protein
MLFSEVLQATRVCFSLKTIGYRARPSFPTIRTPAPNCALGNGSTGLTNRAQMKKPRCKRGLVSALRESLFVLDEQDSKIRTELIRGNKNTTPLSRDDACAQIPKPGQRAPLARIPTRSRLQHTSFCLALALSDCEWTTGNGNFKPVCGGVYDDWQAYFQLSELQCALSNRQSRSRSGNHRPSANVSRLRWPTSGARRQICDQVFLAAKCWANPEMETAPLSRRKGAARAHLIGNRQSGRASITQHSNPP